jgi:hypothetical protein
MYLAADLQEYASGGLDVSASMNREYHQAPCTASRTERALRS